MLKNYFHLFEKVRNKSFFLVLLLFATFPSFCQITIGGGTSTQRFPFNYWYGYSRTATIYGAAEMNTVTAGSTITTISWYSTIASTVTGPTVIYLKQVGSTTAVASDTWANTITGATTVYTGTPASWTVGWNSIDITDYPIAAGQNLEILVECNTGGGGTGTSTSTAFQYTSGPTSSNAYWQVDNAAPTGTPTTTNTLRPNVILGGLTPPACTAPTGITIGSVTTSSASVSFTSSGSNFIVEYGAIGFTPGTGATAGTGGTIVSGTSSPIVINGLTAATGYDVYIRQNCTGSGNGYSLNTSKATFTSSSNPPVNDNSSGAIALTVNLNLNCGATTNGTTLGATQSPDAAPTCSATGINDDVWFTFSATNTNHRFVYTNVTTGTMATALYTGTPGSLTQVAGACFSGTTQDFTGLAIGTVYYARVYTTVATATTITNFTVCVGTLPPVPANDNICGAVTVNTSPNAACSTILTGQSTASATQSLVGCVGTADEDVWYKFVATDTMHTIALTNSGNGVTDRVHQIFSSSDNTCTGTLTSVKCSDDETSTTGGLTIGNTYFVRVYSYTSTVTSFATFDICITSPAIAAPPPSNDNASGAITLTVGAGCTGAAYSNVGATLNTGEPYPSCSGVANTPVWFKFVAPASGAVRISTDVGTGGTFTDPKVAIFSATNAADYTTFSIISCDDDGGSVNVDAAVVYATALIAGTTYYIAVDRYSPTTTTGSFCIAVDELNSAMLATANTCTSNYQTPTSNSSTAYTGWAPLVDGSSRLIALVRNPAGGSVSSYTSAQNVNTGTVRQANGTYYLNRNYRITNSSATNVNVQLFFLNTELTSLTAADPAVTLANLGVTRQAEATAGCYNDFNAANGAITFIPQTGNGTVGGVSWINFTTPAFSNFYLNRAGTALPITLQYLKGLKAGTGNALNWKVNCTSVSITMELERSSDSRTFKSITSITATQARCGQPFDYVDAAPLKGTNYYRLKMIDVDGKVTYSPIVAIINGGSGAELVGIYPTVVRDEAFLSVAVSRSTKMQIRISDMSGKVIRTISQTVANGSSLLSINTANLATGVYNITGMLDGVQTKTLRFVKQ